MVGSVSGAELEVGWDEREGGEMMRKAVSRSLGISSCGSIDDDDRSTGRSSIEHTSIRPSTFAIRDGGFFQSLPLLEDVEASVTIRRTIPSRSWREASRRVGPCFQKRSGVRPYNSEVTIVSRIK